MSGFQPPSTYTPLSRRFGSEKDREIEETRQLYDWVAAHQNALGDSAYDLADRVATDFLDEFPGAVAEAITRAVRELAALERHIWELPAADVGRLTMQEFVEYRNLLYAKQHFFANKDELLQLLYEGLARLAYGTLDELPPVAASSPFTIPLVYALPDPKLMIECIQGTIEGYHSRGLFRRLGEQLFRNSCRASGRDPDDPDSRKPLIRPTDTKLPPDELVSAFLGHTPLADVFMTPVPLKLTNEDRFGHWHALAGSGSGKTVLIENLIRHDLASPDRPSIVLVDPHSDLVRKLMRSDLGIDEDRLILIDPRDTKHPVALNPFAVNKDRFATYDEVTREQVTAGVIETLGYLWNGLTNLTLTGKQDVFFKYVVRLLLTLPEVEGRNATIIDMLKLMSDPTPYGRAIGRLPDIQREFFMRDFMNKTFEGTKEQVRYRIQAIIENPTMARLFMSPETKVDFFTELNRGSVILVDTAKDFLKDSSAIFGKLMISLILQAVLERAAIPEFERHPTFLMVDEAGSFFSQNIDDLLTEARKYKTGILLAHQYLEQGTSSLRASLAANTSIKFASGLSAQDAGTMAREMRTTPDFILAQPKLQFAAHIRGVTPHAVSVPVKPIRDYGIVSDAAHAARIERNRKRVALDPESRRWMERGTSDPQGQNDPLDSVMSTAPASMDDGPGEDISYE